MKVIKIKKYKEKEFVKKEKKKKRSPEDSHTTKPIVRTGYMKISPNAKAPGGNRRRRLSRSAVEDGERCGCRRDVKSRDALKHIIINTCRKLPPIPHPTFAQGRLPRVPQHQQMDCSLHGPVKLAARQCVAAGGPALRIQDKSGARINIFSNKNILVKITVNCSH